MCGIAGIVVSKAGGVDLSSTVERMQIKLAHRGPDDHGLFVSRDGRCALAHTRLSILDLSPAGHQPMGLWGEMAGSKEQGVWSREQGTGKRTDVRGQSSVVSSQRSAVEQDGRYWITYNGEIYNYRELREDLNSEIRSQRSEVSQQVVGNTGDNSQFEIRNPQYRWYSNTDTEVILRAYRRWGIDCLQKLRGMFAFAIYDRGPETTDGNGQLFLARDPFGIKPVYYYFTGEVFAFASEVRALLESGLVPRRLSLDGLASYLQFGSVQDPLTMIEGVQSLLPGHYLVVKLKGDSLQIESSEYASEVFNQNANPQITNRAEAVQILRSKLEESVQHHLVSDVPVAAFLSGGIDSSAVVGLMSRVSNERPRTFTVSFEEAEFSEQSYASLIARKFKTEHKDIHLSGKTLMEMLPDAFAAMDQPTMDGINTYVISRAVKHSGIKVALSGLGGDELFAGYPTFHRAQQLSKLSPAPYGLRKIASITGRAFTNGSVRYRKLWEMLESDCSPYAAYAISRQLFSPAEISTLTRDQRSDVSSQSAEPGKFEIRNSQSEIGVPPDVDVLNAVSWYELAGYMSNTLLRDTDQMSMAHALEVRVPFIDPVVVPLVLSMPGDWKLNGSRPKPLLLDALDDILPEEIWRRPKMGFTFPFERWMQSSLQADIDSVFSDEKKLKQSGISGFVKNVWQTFLETPSKERWSRPWALYVLAKWCELNHVRL